MFLSSYSDVANICNLLIDMFQDAFLYTVVS